MIGARLTTLLATASGSSAANQRAETEVGGGFAEDAEFPAVPDPVQPSHQSDQGAKLARPWARLNAYQFVREQGRSAQI
jgi:hypothetical protein